MLNKKDARIVKIIVATGFVFSVSAIIIGVMSCKSTTESSMPSSIDPIRHVILIVVDTLRADQMNMYTDSELPTTPYLDKFANNAVIFEDCYTVRSLTRPSFTSLFTGEHPTTHGVYSNEQVWDEGQHSLVEDFRDAGFTTVGIAASTVINSNHGCAAGFTTYYDVNRDWNWCRFYDDTGYDLTAPEAHRDILSLLVTEVINQNHPNLFLMIHLWEVHSSYEAPEEFMWKVGCDPDYDGPMTGGAHLLENWGAQENRILTDEDLLHARNLYRAQIAWTDSNIEHIFEQLKDAGMWESSIVVVMSDHGESLGENHRFLHALDTEWELHIPLMIHFPGQDFQVRVPGLVEITDVLPTIAEACGVDIPDVHGVSHLRRVGDPTIPGRPGLLSIGGTNDGKIEFSVWDGEWRRAIDIVDDEVVDCEPRMTPEQILELEALGYL